MDNVNYAREDGIALGMQLRQDLLVLAGERLGHPEESWQEVSLRVGAYLEGLSGFFVIAAMGGEMEPGVTKMSAIIVTEEGDENTED